MRDRVFNGNADKLIMTTRFLASLKNCYKRFKSGDYTLNIEISILVIVWTLVGFKYLYKIEVNNRTPSGTQKEYFEYYDYVKPYGPHAPGDEY